MNYQIVTDLGRSRGAIDKISAVSNHGPLVQKNRLADNAINGMVVRGGVMTTEGVWDDTDIVHVIQDEIVSSDFNHYGGLRLTSTPGQSLVVKASGQNAGITAHGVALDNANRIGGSVQIIGLPNYPVILTSLADNSVGAGFTPAGITQKDTIPAPTGNGVDTVLPTGPEVNNGLLIDDDVNVNTPGFFSFDVGAGGSSNFAGRGGITAQGNTQLLVNSNVVFAFQNYVDVGGNGGAFTLASTTITTQPTLVSPDLVRSAGTFQGSSGLVTWQVETFMDNGIARVNNRVTFTSTTGTLGNLRLINYLDEDVQGVSDDLLYTTGTPGQADFRAFTLDGPERIGFSHGGVYSLTPGKLENANYIGWAADQYDELELAIQGAGTTYTPQGNIDTTSLTPFVDSQLGNVYGLEDITTAFAWDVESTSNRSIITTFLELVPRNPTTAASSGDWRSVLLDTNSNDRNASIKSEAESSKSTDAHANDTTQSAQFLGSLAANEKAGDENRRLAFQIMGNIASPSDVDVYSFNGIGGTEVWLDIDNTDNSLDTVVELVDADGRTLALSDNSLAEEANPALLYKSADMAQFSVNPLRKSPKELYYASATGAPKDLYSTNPRDAGMRVVLPGAAGEGNLYHVRVRSAGGLTAGYYSLQVRLQETDEIPGSAVTYADIRYASNGLDLRGVPGNSPLLGENGEIESVAITNTRNDTFNAAQYLGNLLQTNRQAISVAGNLDNFTDVDWFSFDIAYQRITPSGLREYFATMFDVDYANGIGRPDTSIYLFDANGNLMLAGLTSALVDDQAGPISGADNSDLSRGSAGKLDPLVGSYELPAGRYFLAVTNSDMVPAVMAGYTNANSSPLVRLQPIDSLQLIADDHVDFIGGSNGGIPVLTNLFDNSSVVQYDLSDMVLYVSQTVGSERTNVYLVNPFTGETRNQLSRGNFDVQDIAMRTNGTLQAFDRTWQTPSQADRDGLLDYVTINTTSGAFTNNTVTYDTYNIDPSQNPPTSVASNDGWNPEALTFAANLGGIPERGFMVANRPTPFGSDPNYFDPAADGFSFTQIPINTNVVVNNVGLSRPGVTQFTNVVFEFDPNNGTAVSSTSNPGARKTGIAQGVGPGTDIFERGRIETYTLDINGNRVTRSTQLVAREVTTASGSNVTRVIRDGDTFSVIDSTNFRTVFEFDLGPEVQLVDYTRVRDGMQFTLDGVVYEFEVAGGAVGVTPGANAISLPANASLQQFLDAIRQALPTSISLGYDSGRMNFAGATTGVFTQLQIGGVLTSFGTQGGVGAGRVAVRVLASDTASTVAARIVQTVNSLNIPGLSATSNGSTIQFFGVQVDNAGSLFVSGIAPGGIIRGATMVGTTMYAVSDNGGLYTVSGGQLSGYGGTRNIGNYVPGSYELTGIEFAAITAGPSLVSNGSLTQILFGLDTAGNLHAFDTTGHLQPVFANGATSMATGLTGANGLAFSTLNQNLWKTTSNRGTDPGHGINETGNNSRTTTLGGTSWYFGVDNPGAPNDRTYDFPGGAAGAMESNTFSLKGISSGGSANVVLQLLPKYRSCSIGSVDRK
ncbi:MAG: hypothetical protein U0930_00560 [Pirellulales bacterium]